MQLIVSESFGDKERKGVAISNSQLASIVGLVFLKIKRGEGVFNQHRTGGVLYGALEHFSCISTFLHSKKLPNIHIGIRRRRTHTRGRKWGTVKSNPHVDLSLLSLLVALRFIKYFIK